MVQLFHFLGEKKKWNRVDRSKESTWKAEDDWSLDICTVHMSHSYEDIRIVCIHVWQMALCSSTCIRIMPLTCVFCILKTIGQVWTVHSLSISISDWLRIITWKRSGSLALKWTIWFISRELCLKPCMRIHQSHPIIRYTAVKKEKTKRPTWTILSHQQGQ